VRLFEWLWVAREEVVTALDAHFYNADGSPKDLDTVDFETEIYGKVTEPPSRWSGEALRVDGFISRQIDFNEGGYEYMLKTVMAPFFEGTSLEYVDGAEVRAMVEIQKDSGDLWFTNMFLSTYRVPGHEGTVNYVLETYFAVFDGETHLQKFLGHYAHDAGLLRIVEAGRGFADTADLYPITGDCYKC